MYRHVLDTFATVHTVTRQVQVEPHAARHRDQALEASVHAQVLAERDARLAEVAYRAEQAEQRAFRAEHDIAALYASSSWRITRPARAAMSLLRRSLTVGVSRLLAHRQARSLAICILARFPALKGRLRALDYRSQQAAPATGATAATDDSGAAGRLQEALSEPAQRILSELQRNARHAVGDQ